MLSEDEALLQLDRELDERMRNLCGKRLNSSPVDTDEGNRSTISERGSYFVRDVSPRKSCQDDNSAAKMEMKLNKDSNWIDKNADFVNADSDIHHKGCISKMDYSKEENSFQDVDRSGSEKAVSSLAAEVEHNGKEEADEVSKNLSSEDVEELEEAKDAVFDEFLDKSTQIRIKSLTNKVAALTEALNVMQAECKKLAHAKQEAISASHFAEMSRRNMNKQLQTFQQESTRHLKSNKHLQERVKELTCECQTLRKELSSSRQSECEHKNAQSSSHAQLTRSRADNAALKEQMTNLKRRHKDELEELRVTVTSSNSRVKELERQQRNYTALVKKQELLIRVLNEQKSNIGVAKAAACLEDKFLSVLTPLQPP